MYATLLRADRRNGTAGIANIRPVPFSRTACTLLSSSLPFSFSLSLVSLFRTIFKKADSFSIYYLALYHSRLIVLDARTASPKVPKDTDIKYNG